MHSVCNYLKLENAMVKIRQRTAARLEKIDLILKELLLVGNNNHKIVG